MWEAAVALWPAIAVLGAIAVFVLVAFLLRPQNANDRSVEWSLTLDRLSIPPFVLVSQDRDGMVMLAGVRGTLTDTNGCLGLSGSPVIWPEGTTIVSTDPFAIQVDGKTYELGDAVSLTGGNVGRIHDRGLRVDAPARCLQAENFWDAS